MLSSFVEGFGNNPFNSQFKNINVVSEGPSAEKASVYQASRMPTGTSWSDYKRPTPIRTPRGDDVAAPTVATASQYLRQKYGDFSGAAEIGPPPVATPLQVEIQGRKVLTLGDLKLLQNTVDMELLRLQNMRIPSSAVQIRIAQLEVVGDNLAEEVGAVERGEKDVGSVAIFPATARAFIRTFQTSDILPDLFDPDGKTPGTAAAAPAAAPAPAAPSVVGAPAAADDTSHQSLFEKLQFLKWQLEMDYDVEAAKHRELRKALDEMEKRLVSYTYGSAQMPPAYRRLFLDKIRDIRRELNGTPE